MSAFQGPEELANALKDCDVVLIPAGVPRKPGKPHPLSFIHYNPFNFQGMTRDDLFNTNATIVLKLSEAAAQ